LGKRSGIRKTVTGGKIKEVFKIEQTERGKEIVAVKKFEDDEEVKKRGSRPDTR